MFGRSWMIWAGVVSVREDERASGMRKPSAAGGAWSGQPLKKAQKEGRTIIFIDESGISQRPHRVRTWSPRGETPVLQYNFNWDTPYGEKTHAARL